MNELDERQLAWLERYGFDPLLFENWRKGVHQGWLSAENNKVKGELLPPDADTIDDLPRADSDQGRELVARGAEEIAAGRLGVVILNGGMATRFGGVVKGTVPVLGEERSFLGLRFLDVLQAQERWGGRIPVFLMNSFATADATRAHVEGHDNFGLDPDQVHHFDQFVSLRMDENGDLFRTDDGDVSPHGPGHGDFAPAFRQSGCLRHFLEGGGRTLFVSNVDNLAARVNPVVIGHHLRSGAEATVELAPKWPGDVGGAPYNVDGKLQLVEQLRYPEGFDPDVVDVFNTNTFHFTAEALDRDFDLGWYHVDKEVDGRKAIQVERLIGELTRFLTNNFVRVRRSGPETRFLPIKTPDDLEGAKDEIRELYGVS